MCGIRRFNSAAQSTLELTIGMIACIIMIMGITRVFVWLNTSIVDRQTGFQNTRTDPRTRIVDFYVPERLNILK